MKQLFKSYLGLRVISFTNIQIWKEMVRKRNGFPCLFELYSIIEKTQLQIISTAHANVTAVTNNQQKLTNSDSMSLKMNNTK